ncbi:MAG: hypothetical protein A4E52_00802 [Pelotomaculum sp. PtaB.Bin013]|nr:MAG: hypothetical protein A4E52_00802 [Pelotomaculum sp. PtaB.Bin013]
MYGGPCLYIGQRLLFIDKEVILLRIYRPLDLAKIQLISDGIEMIIDIKCLTDEPDLTNTIPLGIWR